MGVIRDLESMRYKLYYNEEYREVDPIFLSIVNSIYKSVSKIIQEKVYVSSKMGIKIKAIIFIKYHYFLNVAIIWYRTIMET